MWTKLLNSASEWQAVIVDDCCRARTHFRDGHRDDGVNRMICAVNSPRLVN
jgi:hypothetical protein